LTKATTGDGRTEEASVSEATDFNAEGPAAKDHFRTGRICTRRQGRHILDRRPGILQNSVSAENVSDKFSASNFG
jgi:hypothetical protein